MRFEWIVRGVVVGSAHGTDLCPVGHPGFDQGAHAGRVRSQRRDLDREVVVVVLGVVAVVDDVVRAGIGEDDIDIAVAFRIEARDAPALPTVFEPEIGRPLFEGSVPLGIEEAHRDVAKIRSRVLAPAIYLEDVEIAVVVEVGRTGSPPPAAIGDVGSLGGVFEDTGSGVAVQAVSRAVTAGDVV